MHSDNPEVILLLMMLVDLDVVPDDFRWILGVPDDQYFDSNDWQLFINSYTDKYRVPDALRKSIEEIEKQIMVKQYYDEVELDKEELRELIRQNLHLQFRQSNPTPNIFGPRCRCQSPSSFAIDSS